MLPTGSIAEPVGDGQSLVYYYRLALGPHDVVHGLKLEVQAYGAVGSDAARRTMSATLADATVEIVVRVPLNAALDPDAAELNPHPLGRHPRCL